MHYFFNEDYAFEDEVVAKLKAKPENGALLQACSDALAVVDDWSEHGVHVALEGAAAAKGVKTGALMPLLRFALTGQSRGPGVTTILDLLGRERCGARIERACSLL